MAIPYVDFKLTKALAADDAPFRAYGVWGDGFLQDRVINDLLETTLEESARDFNLDTLDGETAKVADVLAAAGNLPFLSERRAILVKRAERLEGVGKGDSDSPKKKSASTISPAKRLIEGLGNLPPTTVLIFARTPETPEVGERAGERCLNAALDKEIEKVGLLVNCTLDSKNVGMATAILEQEAESRGYSLARGAAAHLVSRCGQNLARLFNEMEKCALSAGTGRVITPAIIDEMTRPTLQDTVFNLTDAIGEKRGAQALEILRDLMEAGEPPELLLSLITRHLRQLMQARALLDARLPLDNTLARRLTPEMAAQLPQDGRDNLATLFSSQSWMGRRLGAQARNFSAPQLQKALEAVFATDLATKGIEGDGGFDSKHHSAASLEILLARLCSL